MFDYSEIVTLLSLVTREIQDTKQTAKTSMYIERLETINEKLKGMVA
jgi:hypothetical protein